MLCYKDDNRVSETRRDDREPYRDQRRDLPVLPRSPPQQSQGMDGRKPWALSDRRRPADARAARRTDSGRAKTISLVRRQRPNGREFLAYQPGYPLRQGQDALPPADVSNASAWRRKEPAS